MIDRPENEYLLRTPSHTGKKGTIIRGYSATDALTRFLDTTVANMNRVSSRTPWKPSAQYRVTLLSDHDTVILDIEPTPPVRSFTVRFKKSSQS